MSYRVTIPQWSGGQFLRIVEIEADTAVEATEKIVNWVNRRAGYHYCDSLPIGTKVEKETQND